MKRIFCCLCILLCSVYVNAVTISGKEMTVVGESSLYHLDFDSTLEEGREFKITCSENAYLCIPNFGNTQSYNMIAPLSCSIELKWISAGNGFIKVEQIEPEESENSDTFEVMAKEPFDLEDGYSGDPLILSVSDSEIDLYESMNIRIIEYYCAEPDFVEWNVGGDRFQTESLFTKVDFLKSGSITIIAEIHFKWTNETKTVSTSVNVIPVAPDLAGTTIIGKTKLGIGSQASYIVNKYSTTSVEYIWSISPERNINILGSSGQSINVEFLSAGFYTIKCQAKDKMTGLLGSPTSLSVTVSEDYGIMRVSDELFKAYLESSNVLRVSPVNAEAIQAVNQVRYTLCNLTSGAAVGSGYVNKDFDTAIDVSALRKGIYVLYIQVDGKAAFSYKFSLN